MNEVINKKNINKCYSPLILVSMWYLYINMSSIDKIACFPFLYLSSYQFEFDERKEGILLHNIEVYWLNDFINHKDMFPIKWKIRWYEVE